MAVGLLAIGAAACGGASGAPGNGAGPGAGGGGGVPVEMLTLTEHPVELTTEFVGTVKSRRSTTVQSQAEGFIQKINVTSGDRVTPGTVLFEIDNSSQLAAVAGLESVRAAREADATFARQQVERAKKLLAVGAMSQQEYDQAQAAQRTTEAQLKAVEAQIRQQRNELGYFKVTAATSGVIGDIPVRVGDRIIKATPLTTIEDNSGLELYLNVPVQEAPRLKLGLAVRVLSESGAEVATQRITFVAPSVDDATQTILVKTPIESRGGIVRADQFVRARVVWSTTPALTVPVIAVSRISGQFFVFVAEPGPGGGLAAHLRPLTLGATVGSEYVVREGLSAGDRVIVGGIQKIGEGVPVTPAPPAGGAPGGQPAGSN